MWISWAAVALGAPTEPDPPFVSERVAERGHQAHLAGAGVAAAGLSVTLVAGAMAVGRPDPTGAERVALAGALGAAGGLIFSAGAPVLTVRRLRRGGLEAPSAAGWIGLGLSTAGIGALAVSATNESTALAYAGLGATVAGVAAARVQDHTNRQRANGTVACLPTGVGIGCRF